MATVEVKLLGGFAVVADGRVIGCADVDEVQDGCGELGYWLERDYWGRGVATRALVAFLAHETVRPLYAYVAKHNIGSLRVLEKCGFTIYREEAEGIVLKLGT